MLSYLLILSTFYSPFSGCSSHKLSISHRPSIHGATLQIDRSGWLTNSYDTHTTDKLYQHSLTLSGSDPSHREVGRQTASGVTNPPPATPTPAQRCFRQRGNILHRSAQYRDSIVPGDQSRVWAGSHPASRVQLQAS